MPNTQLSKLKKEISELENEKAIKLILGYDANTDQTLYWYSTKSYNEGQKSAIRELASQRLDKSTGITTTMVTQNRNEIILFSHRDSLSAVIIADSKAITTALARTHSLLLIDFLSCLLQSRSEHQEPNANDAQATETLASPQAKQPRQYPKPRSKPQKIRRNYPKPNSLPPF
ncbi:hypothetical protein [Cerasicoccus frondis]|uniref:hypothetical protein n=1 Tax=Cerasicoccus frondis TaxID=490090 RepID=UPI002852D04D|nr:hypothetical protein [Cerasicoccus frondis]